MRYFRQSWFIALCFFILIKPGCISGMAVLAPLDTVLNLLRILLVLFEILVFMKSMLVVQKNRLLGVFSLVLLSILWEPASTVLNGKNIADVGALLNNLGIALTTYMGLRINYDAFIEGIAKITGAYVILNCLTVILFPAGMYASAQYTQNFFLSYRTAWFAIYLLALTAVLMWNANARTQASRSFAIAVVLSAAVSMILQWTATGLFCFVLGGIVLAIFSRTSRKPLGIFWILLGESAVFWLVVIARMLEMFSFLLVTILKKDLTLTFRTRIWDNALIAIQKHFLIGVGRLDAGQMRSILGYGVSHPHNHYLYVTLCFGVVGLVLFLLTVYFANKGKVSYGKLQEGRIMMASFITLLTAGQVESFPATWGYIMPLFLIAAALHRNDGMRKKSKMNNGRNISILYHK